MKTNTLLLSMFIAFGLFSCKKENKNHSQATQHQPENNLKQISSCNPDNTYNPADYTGQWHNEALTYAYNNVLLDGVNDKEEMVDAIEMYFSSSLSHPINLNVVNIYTSAANYSQIGIAEFVDPTSTVGAEINNLSTMVTTSFSNNNNNYCGDIKPIITGWETNVIANQNYSAEEKEALLVFGSVFRQSLFYWSNQDVTLGTDVSAFPFVAAADAAAAVAWYIDNPENEKGWKRVKSAVAFGASVSAFVKGIIYDSW